MKKIILLTTLLLTVFLFAGCASRENQIDKISADSAKKIALEAAGVSATEATFLTVELEDRDGQIYYDVEFYGQDYTEYDYDIDAYTGEILSFDHDAEYYEKPADKAGINESTASLTEADTKGIALGQVPGAAEIDIRYG